VKPEGALNVTEPPEQILVLPLAVTTGVANEARLTVWVPIEKHPFLEVTLTESDTLPEAPAVNCILLLVLPEVIVPFVIVHA
jgi:hypothetical protein